MLESFTLETFEPHVGTTFLVHDATEEPLTMTLERVTKARAGTDLTTHELWSSVQTVLQEHLTGPNYHMWVRPTMLARCDDEPESVVPPSGAGPGCH